MVIRAELERLINDPEYVREKRIEIFDCLEKRPSVRIPIEIPDTGLLAFALKCREAAESLHRGIGVNVCPVFFNEEFLSTEGLKTSPSAPWVYQKSRNFAHLYLTKGFREEVAVLASLEGVAHLGLIAGMVYVACSHHREEKVVFWNPDQRTWIFYPDFIRRFNNFGHRAMTMDMVPEPDPEQIPS